MNRDMEETRKMLAEHSKKLNLAKYRKLDTKYSDTVKTNRYKELTNDGQEVTNITINFKTDWRKCLEEIYDYSCYNYFYDYKKDTCLKGRFTFDPKLKLNISFNIDEETISAQRFFILYARVIIKLIGETYQDKRVQQKIRKFKDELNEIHIHVEYFGKMMYFYSEDGDVLDVVVQSNYLNHLMSVGSEITFEIDSEMAGIKNDYMDCRDKLIQYIDDEIKIRKILQGKDNGSEITQYYDGIKSSFYKIANKTIYINFYDLEEFVYEYYKNLRYMIKDVINANEELKVYIETEGVKIGKHNRINICGQ